MQFGKSIIFKRGELLKNKKKNKDDKNNENSSDDYDNHNICWGKLIDKWTFW